MKQLVGTSPIYLLAAIDFLKLKRLFPYLCFLVACSSNNGKPVTSQRRLQVDFQPAFTEHSHIIIAGDSLRIALDRHPYLETGPGPDTFYYRQIRLSKVQADYLDSAIIQPVNRTGKELLPIIRDGIRISFLRFDGVSTDTLTYLSPSTGSVGNRLSMTSISFFKRAFQDSVLSPYFDEVAEYLQHTNARSDSDAWNALKRRREAMYPNFKYRR